MNEHVNEQAVDHVDAGAGESLPGDPGGDPQAEKADAGGRGGLVLDALARLPERAILDEAALAKALHVAPRTLRRMVDRWQLPPAVRLGNRNVWYSGRVLSFIEASMIRAEQAGERAARKWRENNA